MTTTAVLIENTLSLLDWVLTPAVLSTLLAVVISISFFAVYAVLLTSRGRSFKGKVVVITGCSSGIGEELAYKYAKHGSKLVLAARRLDKLQSIVDQCNALGAVATAVATDVTKEEECSHLIEEAVRLYNGLDLLILNAGQGCLMKVSDMTDTKPLRAAMEVNFWGCVYPTIKALPHLRKAGGAICVISSLASILPTPRRALYGATKSAVNIFFGSLRSEEPTLHVTIVCPGFVMTEFHQNSFAAAGGPPKRKMGSFMTPKECASQIVRAVAEGKREHIMSSSGRLGNRLRPFFPGAVDRFSASHAEKSILKEE
ncbi:short-chain dehydrogenase/reductase family protein [Planoprotostelium fungivorum]|uniref:Short-chain dehydrogenase/reductase family protein n=1 Tax=Planoprotostelium fungivorum TaxID=1890364 RepID=A0A2P6NWE7_9EUKA|nr:short-chain dehydrogenase/reductase family protein [Planoprotostelium fungivorum]